MSKCSNCGSTITCGCQKRKLSNGKMGCSKCVAGIPNKSSTSEKSTNTTIINKV
jgi:hypothetical protein